MRSRENGIHTINAIAHKFFIIGDGSNELQEIPLQFFTALAANVFVGTDIVALQGARAITARGFNMDAFATDTTAENAGEKINFPCLVVAKIAFVLVTNFAGTIPRFRIDDGRDATRNADYFIIGFESATALFAIGRSRQAEIIGIDANVFFIPKQITQGVFTEGKTAPGAKTIFIEPFTNRPITIATNKHIENLPDGACFVGLDNIMPVAIHTKAKGRATAHMYAPLCHFMHHHVDALLHRFAFVLGKGGKNIEHEAAGRIGSINIFAGRNEGNVIGIKNIFHDIEGIAQGAGETIQSPDDDRVQEAGAAIGKHGL